MADDSNMFKSKGKFYMYMWASTVDLVGVQLVSEGIIFPFVEPQRYNSAYAWCYRNFVPLLEKAGVKKQMWEWRSHGEPVVEEKAMGDEQVAALPSSSLVSARRGFRQSRLRTQACTRHRFL